MKKEEEEEKRPLNLVQQEKEMLLFDADTEENHQVYGGSSGSNNNTSKAKNEEPKNNGLLNGATTMDNNDDITTDNNNSRANLEGADNDLSFGAKAAILDHVKKSLVADVKRSFASLWPNKQPDKVIANGFVSSSTITSTAAATQDQVSSGATEQDQMPITIAAVENEDKIVTVTIIFKYGDQNREVPISNITATDDQGNKVPFTAVSEKFQA